MFFRGKKLDNRVSWKVSQAAQDQAKALTCPAGNEQITIEKQHVLHSPVFRIKAYAYNGSGVLKILNLGSWPSAPYQVRVEKLLDDDDFFNALDERLASKLDSGAILESIYVCIGKNWKSTRVSRDMPNLDY